MVLRAFVDITSAPACLPRDLMGFLEDLEGLLARASRSYRNARWMRSARGLYGGARVAGMYRNEWVHFGRVYACEFQPAGSRVLLYIYIYISSPPSSATSALRYAIACTLQDREESFEGCLWGWYEIENFVSYPIRIWCDGLRILGGI